ncbi:TetR family transcriptional regulator [Geotalea uraniireducens]|uniref:TetR family transcriptional regulator n=1 Tax=Geotalea uraniireducens TaxID=351604 RepID=A0ABN6VP33_9BACT|nr:TetR/AcrR family transcriptional regulator [Geotalea uraniireducens]BDV42039.1 TetR family transcriptional regulator [Geotalea uraniireducens]
MITKKNTRIRKEEIIQATFAVIGSRGMHGLTIAAIAEEAGMSEANIYRHFGGKTDILLALAEFIGSAVMGKAAAIAAGSRKPLEKLETIFFSHVELIAEMPGIPRFVFSEDVQRGEPQLAEAIAFRIGAYVETLAGIIAAGIVEEELRRSLQPRETAVTLLGMIQMTALRWSIGKASFDMKDEATRLWSNFLRLVTDR